MITKVVCFSLCLALLVDGQGSPDSPPSIITILTMASCKSTCKNGTCKQQVETVLFNIVKCECNAGWIGEKCDVPVGLGALMFHFSSPFPIASAATDADLALIDKRVRDRDTLCAENFVCHNGGYCTGDATRGYKCKCDAPYTGTFCTELCEKKCYNGGECFREIKFENGNMPVNQVCKCPRQYQGEFCEFKLNL